jgi:D-ornithine 4,5-aminomutase subunit beta
MLKPNEKIDIRHILSDLEKYRPRRKGWVWRQVGPQTIGAFDYVQASPTLKRLFRFQVQDHSMISIHNQMRPSQQKLHLGDLKMTSDACVWLLIMVQIILWSFAQQVNLTWMDLLEGTPQGIGGVPITRKQVRAQRKALDLIEDEVGRPINYHSYVSGVAGPEIAVMFTEEGVNGAHQDPQYNVLYRNINMVRSFVDAAESKKIMAYGGLAQIDGAHNANATARDAWKVMPELIVQHGINSRMSEKIGIHQI